ncbi:hydroxyproline-rich glycoprotein family protein isoform X2 [Carex rostrata]
MQAVARFSSSKRGRGKSYAASVKDETTKTHRIRKGIPKKERRAMIVSFVEKYRASNEGRFPHVSKVIKEIGGSYYVAREIVQELEYKYKYKLVQAGQSNLAQPVELKESSNGTSSDLIGEKVASTVAVANKVTRKGRQRSTEAEGVKKEEVCGKSTDVSVEEQGRLVATNDTTTNMDKTQPSFQGKEVKEAIRETITQPSLKVKEVIESRKVETITETVEETPVKSEKFMMRDEIPMPEEIKGKQKSNEHDQSSTEKGSIWGDLKSISDKIINFWKKF